MVSDAYEPVLKLQGKAAQLREELEILGSSNPISARRPSTASAGSHKRGHQRALSVRISEPDAGFAHASSYKGSPAAPYFKPSRPYATSHRSGGKPQRQASASSGESLIHNDVSTLGPAPSGSPTRGLMSPSRKRDSQPSPTDSMSSGKSKRDRSLQSSRHNSFSSPDRKGGPLKASLAMQARDEEAQEKLERRQASYLRREEQMQAEIIDLKARLARAQGDRTKETEQRFGKATQSIEELHGEVVSEIDHLLSKQAMNLKNEEAASLRRFKQKLTDTELELMELRGAFGKADSVWIERTKQLRAELESVQGIAVKLDKMYKLSEEENGRLRAQFKCQEDDREYLIRQVVNLKKDNKKLMAELASMASEAKAASQERDDLLATQTVASADQAQMQEAAGHSVAALSAGEKDVLQVRTQRYEGIIDSLKRLVEAERRRTKQARAAHTAELASRTELQGILRQCVEDVRAQQQALQEGSAQSTPRARTGDSPSTAGPSSGSLAPSGGGTVPGGGSGPGASRPSAFSSSRAGGLRPRPFSAAPAGRQQLGRPSALAVEGGVGLAKPDTAGGMGDLSGTIIGTSLGSQPSRGGGAAEGAPERQQGESEGEARTPVPAPAGAMLSSASAGHAPGLAVVFTGAGGSGRRPPPSRPFSAIPRMQAQRPMSGLRRGSLAGEAGSSMGPLARDSQLSSTPFDRAGTAGAAMGPEEREELIRRLTQKEDVLKALFDRAFPGGPSPPTMPGDVERLDRLAAARDSRDATVVANARALAISSAAAATRTPMAATGGTATMAGASGQSAVGQSIGGGHTARSANVAQDATPGSDLQKEAAARPWVFSVDAMIQDFLSNRS